MSKIVVIGANHAGTAAINTILEHTSEHEVIVLDANSNISFLGCGMALWIGGQIPGPTDLFYSSEKIMSEKGAKVYMETTVNQIDFSTQTVSAIDRNGSSFTIAYDKLILATGSQPVIPPIPGSNLKNVQLVKRYQDAQEIIQKLKTQAIHKIAVVGAGYIGVELAEAFRRHGKEVILIDAAENCLSNYYDENFSNQMSETLKMHGIQLAYQQKILSLEGKDKVEKVVTENSDYPCDMVILALGFVPNSKLGNQKIETYSNGAYLVDRYQRTNIPNVYAIGDCAVVYDNALQSINYIALATNAVRSGIVAAYHICGIPLESPGVQGSNGIHIWELNMVSTGLTLKKAIAYGLDAVAVDFKDNQKPRFMKENASVSIRIVYDNQSRKILGAQLASEYDISMSIHLFSLAIQEQMTIDKLKLLDLFFLPHFNQPYNYITLAALKSTGTKGSNG